MDAPPSWTEWLVDGFTRGHSVAETIAWASWTADFENWQSRQRSRVRRGFYGGQAPHHKGH